MCLWYFHHNGLSFIFHLLAIISMLQKYFEMMNLKLWMIFPPGFIK